MLSHGRENMKQGSVFANVDKWVELPEKKNFKKLLTEYHCKKLGYIW